MGTRGYDFDAIEIVNGKSPVEIVSALRDWYALLRFAPEGRLPVGTANSDSHDLVFGHAGWPVTMLRPAGGAAALDDAGLVAAVQSGTVAGSLGVFAWATARETAGATTVEPGRMPLRALTGLLTVHVTVNAAPWIPVEEIRIRAGGTIIQRIPLAMPMPADPLGTMGVVRFDEDVILTTPLTADTFITVEAGFALPAVADTDGDGVVDAMDRDGDGDVDGDDAMMGEGIDFGESPMPMGAVAAGAHPFGFTNPIFVDVNGDGDYDAPGTPFVD
jgi:hypothetical protein